MAVWLAFDILLLLVTLLPCLRCEHYAVRGWDFPRLQIAWLAGTSILLRLVVVSTWTPTDGVGVGAATATLLMQGWWILPYTRLVRPEVPSTSQPVRERAIRIMTANVLQTNRRADAFIRVVRETEPDVLIVLEADRWWQDQLDQLEASGYRYSQKCPRENFYGMLLYSRLELAETRTEFLVEEEVPSLHGKVRLQSGEWITCHWLHPRPPSPTENPLSGERDAELVAVGKRAADAQVGPTIVAGDLNDVAWSATTRLFRKVSGLLDPRVGRGFFCSYHAKLPGLRWPLDHVFHSADFTLNEIRRLPGIGSDHFPVMMELQLQAAPSPAAEGITSDEADEAWAEDKMAAANVQPGDVPRAHPDGA